MGPRGMRMESGEGSTMRNFIVCTVHLLVKAINPIRWTGHVVRIIGRSDFKILILKPTGKRTLGRPMRRWENIKIHIKEICKNTWNWVDSVQDRDYWRALVNAVLKLRVP